MTEDILRKLRSFLFALLSALLVILPSYALAKAPTYTCIIQAEYPHDPDTSTQGLFFANGKLYESSGGFGESFLAQVDLDTGRHHRKLIIEGRYFAEGIAPQDDKLYLLTWLSGTGFIHSLDTLERLAQFPYRQHSSKSEGWGLTNTGTSFIRSSGDAALHIHGQLDFTLLKTVPIHDADEPVRLLNELEYVGGRVLANIWKKDLIAVIDLQTGEVRAWIDLAPLRQRIAKSSGVANGIAYDRERGKLYVTGKKWDKLFEISIEEVLWRQPVVEQQK